MFSSSPAFPHCIVIFYKHIFQKISMSSISTFQLYSLTLKSKGLAQTCKIEFKGIKIVYSLSSHTAWLSLKVNRYLHVWSNVKQNLNNVENMSLQTRMKKNHFRLSHLSQIHNVAPSGLHKRLNLLVKGSIYRLFSTVPLKNGFLCL